jgi:hypothetical protein
VEQLILHPLQLLHSLSASAGICLCLLQSQQVPLFFREFPLPRFDAFPRAQIVLLPVQLFFRNSLSSHFALLCICIVRSRSTPHLPLLEIHVISMLRLVLFQLHLLDLFLLPPKLFLFLFELHHLGAVQMSLLLCFVAPLFVCTSKARIKVRIVRIQAGVNMARVMLTTSSMALCMLMAFALVVPV